MTGTMHAERTTSIPLETIPIDVTPIEAPAVGAVRASSVTSDANGFGTIALVAGVGALLGSFVSFPLGLLGIVGIAFGAVGLAREQSNRAPAFGGVVASLVALIFSAVLLITFSSGFAVALQQPLQQSAAAASTVGAVRDATLVYEVEGASGSTRIDYQGYEGVVGEHETASGALPFRAEYGVNAGGKWDENVYSITAANGQDDTGEILCRITVNGMTLSQHVASGPDATVKCSANNLGALETN